jgi:hypothetical protein
MAYPSFLAAPAGGVASAGMAVSSKSWPTSNVRWVTFHSPSTLRRQSSVKTVVTPILVDSHHRRSPRHLPEGDRRECSGARPLL